MSIDANVQGGRLREGVTGPTVSKEPSNGVNHRRQWRALEDFAVQWKLSATTTFPLSPQGPLQELAAEDPWTWIRGGRKRKKKRNGAGMAKDIESNDTFGNDNGIGITGNDTGITSDTTRRAKRGRMTGTAEVPKCQLDYIFTSQGLNAARCCLQRHFIDSGHRNLVARLKPHDRLPWIHLRQGGYGLRGWQPRDKADAMAFAAAVESKLVPEGRLADIDPGFFKVAEEKVTEAVVINRGESAAIRQWEANEPDPEKLG